MNNETKKQLQTLIINWIEEGNNMRSGNKLANRIGISNANLSNIKNGKWQQISNDIWNKVAAFFDHKLMDADWKHQETENFKTIQEVLTNAQHLQRRAAIEGFSGVGKSYGIKFYCTQRGNEEAIHIICRRSMNPKKFVQNIAEKLGVNKIASNRYEVEEAIAEKVMRMNKPCLIFDELENLSPTCYSSIKAIIDLTDKHCSIVLSGIDIHTLINHLASKGKDAFAQIRRRFPKFSYEHLPRLDEEEMTSILNSVGIKNRFAQQWFFENVFDLDALENTVRDALRISRHQKVEIDRMFLAEYFGDNSSNFRAA